MDTIWYICGMLLQHLTNSNDCVLMLQVLLGIVSLFMTVYVSIQDIGLTILTDLLACKPVVIQFEWIHILCVLLAAALYSVFMSIDNKRTKCKTCLRRTGVWSLKLCFRLEIQIQESLSCDESNWTIMHDVLTSSDYRYVISTLLAQTIQSWIKRTTVDTVITFWMLKTILKVAKLPLIVMDICRWFFLLLVDLPPSPFPAMDLYMHAARPRGWSNLLTGIALAKFITNPMGGHSDYIFTLGLAMASMYHYVNKLIWISRYYHGNKMKCLIMMSTDLFMQLLTVILSLNHSNCLQGHYYKAICLLLCYLLHNNRSTNCAFLSIMLCCNLVFKMSVSLTRCGWNIVCIFIKLAAKCAGLDPILSVDIFRVMVFCVIMTTCHIHIPAMYALLLCIPFFISFVKAMFLINLMRSVVHISQTHTSWPGMMVFAAGCGENNYVSVNGNDGQNGGNNGRRDDKSGERKRSNDTNSDRRKKYPKKGHQKKEYHSDSAECPGPCFVWKHIGSKAEELEDHDINFKHLDEKYFETARKYLSTESVSFDNCDLSQCMCLKCNLDFYKHRSDDLKCLPLWYRKRQKRQQNENIQQCGVCLLSDTPKWSPHNWLTGLKVTVVSQVFKEQLHGKKLTSDDHLCNACFMKIKNINDSGKCQICTSNFKNYEFTQAENMAGQLSAFFSKQTGTVISVEDHSFICLQCIACFNTESKDRMYGQTVTGQHGQCMQTVISHFKDKIQRVGYLFSSEIKSFYLEKCQAHNLTQTKLATFYRKLHSSFEGEGIQSLCLNNKLGKMFYHRDQMSIEVASNVYALNVEITDHKQTSHEFIDKSISMASLNKMIQDQCKKFPTSAEFDFRSVFNKEHFDDNFKDIQSGGFFLDQYLEPEFVSFLQNATASKRSKRTSNGNETVQSTEKTDENADCTLYTHLRNLKIQMVIALLCNILDPRVIFFQTLVGISAQNCGLNSRGFDILNMFGVLCSYESLRRHGLYWVNMRSAFDELKKFKNVVWRVTIDNLNFHMKYMKTLNVGGFLSKMLNLMTCQVAVLSEDEVTLPVPNTSEERKTTPEDFVLDPAGVEGKEWFSFLSGLSKMFWDRKGEDLNNFNISYISQMRQYFKKCWTPKSTIVFATVSECESAKERDIKEYLDKVKKDLHIGEIDGPKDVVIGGDQQTYALMKNIKNKFPADYEWLYVVPGDWHMMKSFSQCLRDMILDGGFCQFLSAIGVGKPENVYSWQDIHLYLLSLHEALLTYATSQYSKDPESASDPDHSKLFSWLKKKASTDNSDELYRFWAQYTEYLNWYFGFYFSIRSGNWHLRNSCLKQMSCMFFAYSKNKYERLIAENILDIYKLPPHILQAFERGEWTVSLNGNPFHNLALDEAHECIINRRLKMMTTRPSHFRTVQLADFCAYADAVLDGLEKEIFKYSKVTSHGAVDRVQPGKRASKILKLLKSVQLLENKNRQLYNAFAAKQVQLDSSNREDLLSVKYIGSQRYSAFVKQYILQIEPKEKRSWKKLKTFTETKTTFNRQKKTLNFAHELLACAYKVMDDHGIDIPQTCRFPLALCDYTGAMRSRSKSRFKDALLSIPGLGCMFSNKCPFETKEKSDREIIIDLLQCLHQPAPADKKNYGEVLEYYYHKLVWTLGFNRGASVVTIVVDKYHFLPPPRDIVHRERGVDAKDKDMLCQLDSSINIVDPYVRYEQSQFIQDMTNPLKKMAMIRGLCNYIRTMSKVDVSNDQEVIIDSPSFDHVVSIKQNRYDDCVVNRRNRQGEADYSMWFHATQSHCSEVVVCASDTDVYVIGLAMKECGFLENKSVWVERKQNEEYVNINKGVTVISEHKDLCRIPYPVCNVVCLYVISGCDYVEKFEYISSLQFVRNFVQNVSLYCSEGETLLQMQPQRESGQPFFISLNFNVALKLIATVYMSKHLTFFPDRDIADVYSGITRLNTAPEYKQSFVQIGYNDYPVKDLSSLLQFVRCLTNRASKRSSMSTLRKANQELYLMPIESVLKYHLLRTEYVLHLFFNSAFESTNYCFEHDKFGYANIGGSVVIKWDDDLLQVPNNTSKKRCGCSQAGCTGNRKNACQACFWACRPCNVSCKCKASCGNPHNLVGYCDRCKVDNNVNSNGISIGDNISNELTGEISVNMATDEINVNVDVNEADTEYIPTHESEYISDQGEIDEDDRYCSDESFSDDESSNSDEEYIGRPKLICPRNELVYGNNEEMYREIGLDITYL